MENHNEINNVAGMYRRGERQGRQPFLGVGNGPSQTLHVLCYFPLLTHALCGCRVASLTCGDPIDTARHHLLTVGLLPGMCC